MSFGKNTRIFSFRLLIIQESDSLVKTGTTKFIYRSTRNQSSTLISQLSSSAHCKERNQVWLYGAGIARLGIDLQPHCGSLNKNVCHRLIMF